MNFIYGKWQNEIVHHLTWEKSGDWNIGWSWEVRWMHQGFLLLTQDWHHWNISKSVKSGNKGKIYIYRRRSYSTNACYLCLFCINIGKLNHNGFGYIICFEKNGQIRTIDFTKIWGNVNTKSGDAYKQLKNSSIILFSHQIQRVNSLMVKLSFSRLWKYNSQLRTKKNEIPSEPFQILRSTTTQDTILSSNRNLPI